MAVTKQIICLANSRKPHGHCVAGKELHASHVGSWIRPVSNRPDEEISLQEQRLPDGSRPAVLDIVDIPVVEPRPAGHQRENWLLMNQVGWKKVAQLNPNSIGALVDLPEPLWWSSGESSTNDRVSIDLARSLKNSLRFIHVPVMTLTVSWDAEKRRVRVAGVFDYLGLRHRLWVTDPVVEDRYRREPFGEYSLGECWLTVSLSAPRKGICYKLIAAVLERRTLFPQALENQELIAELRRRLKALKR